MGEMKLWRILLLAPFALAWPICAAWMMYLGYSRNEWLDETFLRLEGISFLLVIPWVLSSATLLTDWTMRHWDRNHATKKKDVQP